MLQTQDLEHQRHVIETIDVVALLLDDFHARFLVVAAPALHALLIAGLNEAA
jgi:hypothetical protein